MYKLLSKQDGIAIIRWFEINEKQNWGVWGNYPNLPVGAAYLQYDRFNCVIKLDSPVGLEDSEHAPFKYISSGRGCPGAKNEDDYIGFDVLKAWCLPGEVIDQYEQYKIASEMAYNKALANFNSLPDNIKNEALSISTQPELSRRKRKSAFFEFFTINHETINAVFVDRRSFEKIVDCVANNHHYFPI